MIVGYFFYLNNREADGTNASVKEEVYKLITRDLDGDYYPEFPRDVVEYYSRIVQAYYHTSLEEDEIIGLGKQARKLFDEELLLNNPEEKYYEELKQDIENYNTLERKIFAYSVEKSREVEYITFENRQYAIVTAAYMMREKGTIITVYEDYTLRKDENGRWKILFWEVVLPSEGEYE